MSKRWPLRFRPIGSDGCVLPAGMLSVVAMPAIYRSDDRGRKIQQAYRRRCWTSRRRSRPATPKPAKRIALEAALAEAARTRGVRSIVNRAGDFIGDTGTWLDLAMAKELARSRFTQMGPADLDHAWAWLPNLAQVFVPLAERRAQQAPHTALHFAGLTLTGAQLQQAFEAALGRPLKSARFPWPLLRLATPFSAMLRALFEMRYLWQRPHRLDDSALRALLGKVLQTPLDAVVRQCIAGLPGGDLKPMAQG